jgi:hypothetical protein
MKPFILSMTLLQVTSLGCAGSLPHSSNGSLPRSSEGLSAWIDRDTAWLDHGKEIGPGWVAFDYHWHGVTA